MGIQIAKLIIGAGIVFIVLGIILYFFHDKLHWIGRLPGDIRIESEHVRFYFPVTTMILVSILFSVIIRIAGKFFH